MEIARVLCCERSSVRSLREHKAACSVTMRVAKVNDEMQMNSDSMGGLPKKQVGEVTGDPTGFIITVDRDTMAW